MEPKVYSRRIVESLLSISIFFVICGGCSDTSTNSDYLTQTPSISSIVTLSQKLDASDCPPGYNVIIGTSGDDVLTGTDGSDCIVGLDGNDVIYGLGGDDFIIGGPGDDEIYGGTEKDEIYGEEGNDYIDGGAAHDEIYGGVGNDELYGSGGNDYLYGGDGDDSIFGGDGNDYLYGEAGNDMLSGNENYDNLYGGEGDDSLFGGDNNDNIEGGDGEDSCHDDQSSTDCEEVEPLAVKMLDILATTEGRGVNVWWATGSERKNAGFNVYRLADDGEIERLNNKPIPGQLDVSFGKTYKFHDSLGRVGDVYLVEDIELSGHSHLHQPVKAKESLDVIKPMRIEPNANKPARRLWKNIDSSIDDLKRSFPQLKIAVDKQGLVCIPISDLVDAGLDQESLVNNGLSLQRQDGPVPVIRHDKQYCFIASPQKDRYADFEVITARADIGPDVSIPMNTRRVRHACIQKTSVFANQLEIEENNIYYVASPTEDPFYWAVTFSGYPAELEFETPFPIKADGQISISLTATTQAVGHVHVVDVYLNDTELGQASWLGEQFYNASFSLPDDLLQMENSLRVETVTSEAVFVDKIKVSYSSKLQASKKALRFSAVENQCIQVKGLLGSDLFVFDITDPINPVQLTGFNTYVDDNQTTTLEFVDRFPVLDNDWVHNYLVVDFTDAAAPLAIAPNNRQYFDLAKWSADYLIITHPDFVAAAKRLSSYHQSQGLETLVVTTEEIYDSFNFGRPSPAAIRDLWQAAQNHWSKTPSFVLLVGGATVDSNNYLGSSGQDYIPAPFWKLSDHGYEAVSDMWYVTPADGNAPQAAIGRLAVKSLAEADQVVDKIINWGTATPARLNRILFTVDKDEGVADGQQSAFEHGADKLIHTCLSAEQVAEKLYVESSATPTVDLKTYIDQGVDAVNFLGHAFVSGWSSPTVFSTSHAGGLTNEHLFVMFSWSCFDGSFVGPWGESLSWAMVSNKDGGAIAAIAASTLTNPNLVNILAEHTLCLLTSGESATIGQALQQAKAELIELFPPIQDVIATFNLLGDPATPNPWMTR
jgi:hypothetical protein